MFAATERWDEANPVHTTGTTAGGPRRGSLRPVVGVRWHEGPNPRRGEPPMPQSASHRQTRWTAGRASGRLVAVARALTGAAAGPGGPELAVTRASPQRRAMSALRWSRNGVAVPAMRPTPCRGRALADREQSQQPHEHRFLNTTRRNDQHGQRWLQKPGGNRP